MTSSHGTTLDPLPTYETRLRTEILTSMRLELLASTVYGGALLGGLFIVFSARSNHRVALGVPEEATSLGLNAGS